MPFHFTNEKGLNTILNMDYAASYLNRRGNSLEKWPTFIHESLDNNFHNLTYSECLTPFYGTNDWASWTPEQREKLFYLFCQFNCEALMCFEQCFMFASSGQMKFINSDIEKKAYRHFVREEFLHTKAFRHYLRAESVYNFPQRSLFIHRCHRLKNIFAWILKKEPLAIIIPGAKSETYSLFYTKLLEKVFSSNSNTFTSLNTLHTQDEVFHVQFDYNFVDSTIKNWTLLRQIRFVFYTLLMMLNIQFIVVFGLMNMLKEVAPAMNIFQRIFSVTRFFRWTLWHFSPYQQTRINLRATYKQRKHFVYFFFRLGSL